jgi:bifunctional DNase/RNase
MTRRQLVIRAVRAPVGDAQPVVVMGPLDAPDGPSLALPLGAAEAHTLFHELHGQDTPRAHAMWLVECVVDALGGHLRAARLGREDDHELVGSLEIETSDGQLLDVPLCASQALAVAARLNLPLIAEGDLLEADQRTHLESAVADIVNRLAD